MPDRTDYSPPAVEAPEDRIKRESLEKANQEALAGSFRNTIDQSLRRTSPFSLGRWIARTQLPDDPDFRLTPKLVDELTRDLPANQWQAFADVRSLPEALHVRQTMLDSNDRRQQIAAAGGSGYVAQAFADVVDPWNILTGLATGGASKAKGLAAIARQGFVAGASFAAPTALEAAADPSVSTGEVAGAFFGGVGFGAASHAAASLGRLTRAPIVGLASGAGAGIATAFDDETSAQAGTAFWSAFAQGAVFGAIPPKNSSLLAEFQARQNQAGHRGRTNLEAEIIKTAGPEFLTEPAKATVARAEAEAVESAARVMADADLPQAIKDTLPSEMQGSVGAATQGEISEYRQREEKVQQFLDERAALKGPLDWDASTISDVAEPALTKYVTLNWFGEDKRIPIGRFTAGDVVGGSQVPAYRNLGAMLYPDPIPRRDRPVRYDGITWKNARTASEETRIERTLRDAYAKHAEHARSINQKPLSREEFSKAAGRIRRLGVKTSDPGITAAAQGTSAFYDEHLGLMQRMGVPGAEDIRPDPTYMRRLWDSPRVRDSILAAQEGEVNRLVSEAIRAKNGDLPEKVAPLIAKAVLLRAAKADQHVANPTHELFSVQGKELADRLREDLKGVVSDADLDLAAKHLEAITGTPKPDAENPPATKRRIDMDENYGAELQMKDGTTRWVNISDLLDQNLESNVRSSMHQAYGHAAFIEAMRANFPLEEINTLTQLRQKLEEIGDSEGLQPKQYKDDVETLMAGAKRLLGVPQYENTPGVRTLGMIRDLNTAYFMSNPASGVAQLAEAMDPISWASAKVTARLMPELPGIIKDAWSGRYSDKDLKQLEAIGIIGNSLFNDRIHAKMDHEIGGGMSKAELGSRWAAHAGTTVGGVRHAQAAIEAATVKAISMEWAHRAFNPNESFSDLDLRDMGLYDYEAKPIYDQIRQHGDPNSLEINIAGWSDEAAISAFSKAMDLTAKRLVTRPNPAEQPAWMANTPWGRMLGQFRSFSMQAWDNKLMYAVHRVREGDVGMFARLALQSASAAVAYAAGQGLKAVGKEDPGEFLEKRLAPDEILKASFSRASWASVLPMAVDTGANLMGHDDIFSGSRSTGLRGGFINGNPTYEFITNATTRVPSAFLGPVFNPDYHFSKQDARAIRDLAMPNIIGLRNAVEHLIGELPDRSKQN